MVSKAAQASRRCNGDKRWKDCCSATKRESTVLAMAITDDKDSNMKDDTFVLCGHSCFVPGVRRYVTLRYFICVSRMLKFCDIK
ncbi:hypothetical protein BLOT_009803 [Blomia tropicalis]|nr:hypothetical protein BLOT_009803 [Blomia tropicalis]